MRKIWKWLDDKLEEVLMTISLMGMTAIMGIQIFSRYILGFAPSWSEEITRYLFVWAGFLSVSYCTKRCISIKIEQFVEMFPKRGKAAFKLFNHTIELVFFIYLIPFAVKYLLSAVESGQVSPACHIPMYYIQAAPTPMTFSEVYIGLQQGTIDAQENPYEVIVSNRLYEQQDYIVNTNHLPHLLSLIVNEDFYENLPDETKNIITRAAQTAKKEARTASDERISEKQKVICDSGTQIINLPEKVRKQIRTKAQPVYDEIGKNVNKKIMEAYLAP